MKKITFTIILTLLIAFSNFGQKKFEYKVITSVESIIPSGLGRIR